MSGDRAQGARAARAPRFQPRSSAARPSRAWPPAWPGRRSAATCCSSRRRRCPGKGKLTITGQLGDVMRESAQAALSYVRGHARPAADPDDWFAHHDIHIHVPAGAIPKDGPSAGITMATALMSLVTGRPVRDDTAMTGEITLTGPGAADRRAQGEGAGRAARGHQAACIAPDRNEPDLEDIPERAAQGPRVRVWVEIGGVRRRTRGRGRRVCSAGEASESEARRSHGEEEGGRRPGGGRRGGEELPVRAARDRGRGSAREHRARPTSRRATRHSAEQRQVARRRRSSTTRSSRRTSATPPSRSATRASPCARRPRRRSAAAASAASCCSAIVGGGVALAVSEGLRKKVLDALFGAEEEFEYTSTTTRPRRQRRSRRPPPAARALLDRQQRDVPEDRGGHEGRDPEDRARGRPRFWRGSRSWRPPEPSRALVQHLLHQRSRPTRTRARACRGRSKTIAQPGPGSGTSASPPRMTINAAIANAIR